MDKKSNIEKARHSLSHLLAMAILEKLPKTKLGIGPTIENGFYYDLDLPRPLKDGELQEIEKRVRELAKKDLKFKKEIVTFAEAKKLFASQPYKLELIKELNKAKEKLSIYKTFETIKNPKSKLLATSYFVDLCAGPHVGSTKEISPDAFKLDKIAGAYWHGDEKNKMLTRIYGLAFESKKKLEDYIQMIENAEKCDHRNIGEKLDLFMVDEEIGKGLPIWLPKGYAILKKLEDLMYAFEKRDGYLHVRTPVLAKEELYKKSGHLSHYKEDMYAPIEIEGEKYYLKPMNCPHHHSIYKHHKRSYRELPLRLAEFGHVHRYERSGVLSGMIRVRGFVQNESHIYMAEENLEKEIQSVLNLQKEICGIFGIKDYWYRLSLPDFKNKEKFGDIKNRETWNKGSEVLRKVLIKNGVKFVEAIGEASFYGPKIDVQIKDNWGKEDSLSTIQVDYYSASRFNLFYTDSKGEEKPAVIVHRAIMGSFERFFAFILEKTCGNLPVWLAPIQVKILAISDKQQKYAEELFKKLKAENIDAELAEANETLGKRIRESEMQKIPYTLIVGDKEMESGSVSVRQRNGNQEVMKFEKFLEKIKKEIKEKTSS
ncbi:MAG: threonine--tRNA ligase [Candidatus Wolfebacteria bacterium]|nr:threonine--tRNA ligase [Candidatus Wolfebacteria bacterium]